MPGQVHTVDSDWYSTRNCSRESNIHRVPTENIKQRLQAGYSQTILQTSQEIIQTKGFKGFFTGYATTVLRDVPFSMIQFPLYEYFKIKWKGNI